MSETAYQEIQEYDLVFTDETDQSKKADANKMRASIIPLDILTAIAAVREYGIEKYNTVDGWKEVKAVRYYDALFRHMIAMQGNLNAVDEESGLLHLWHVACNAAFLCALV